MKRHTTRSTLALPPVVPVAFLLAGAVFTGCVAARQRESSPAPGQTQVLADLAAIRGALNAFAANNAGVHPDSLRVLVAPDANGARYLNRTQLPRDPWGREYIYVSGSQPNVSTLGADGRPGGAGDDADMDFASLPKRR